jgi:acetoin utilization protein AcuA
MDRPAANRLRARLDTPQGPVAVHDWCESAFIAGHEMESGLGTFPSYRSLFTSPEGLAKVSRGGQADVVLGIDRQDRIAGYCIMGEPEAREFWGRLGPGTLYEIVGLEVSRNYRKTKLGRLLLDYGLTNELAEERITFMVGYSWTWDLEGSGLSAADYRAMLMRMLQPYGFRRYPTNEPNVALRPENVFMARVGSRVPAETFKKFKNLLFGITQC